MFGSALFAERSPAGIVVLLVFLALIMRRINIAFERTRIRRRLIMADKWPAARQGIDRKARQHS